MEGGRNNIVLLKERSLFHTNVALENNPSKERIQIKL